MKLLFALVAASLTPATLGAPPASEKPDKDVVQAWFDREFSKAQDLPKLGESCVRWHSEDFNTLSVEELAALRAEVKNHPEHPKRPVLESAEAQIQGDKQIMRYELCSGGEGNWRFLFEPAEGQFIDTIYRPGNSWRLTESTLLLFDPKAVAGGKDPEQNPQGQERIFRHYVDDLLFGGLGGGKASQVVPSKVQVDGTQWRVTLARPKNLPPELEIDFEGHWDESAHRGFVDRATITKDGFAPQAVGEVTEYLDWTTEPLSGMWMAHKVSYHRSNGRVWRSLICEESSNLPPGGLDAVSQPPIKGALDAMRGKVNFHDVADYRSGTVVHTSPDGTTASAPLPTLREREGKPTHSVLRLAGWVILGGLVTGIAYLRLRSR